MSGILAAIFARISFAPSFTLNSGECDRSGCGCSGGCKSGVEDNEVHFRS